MDSPQVTDSRPLYDMSIESSLLVKPKGPERYESDLGRVEEDEVGVTAQNCEGIQRIGVCDNSSISIPLGYHHYTMQSSYCLDDAFDEEQRERSFPGTLVTTHHCLHLFGVPLEFQSSLVFIETSVKDEV